MKNVLKKVFLLMIFLIMPIGLSLGLRNAATFVTFEGNGHYASCHDDDSASLSGSGAITLNLSAGVEIALGETFNVTIIVKTFTEAASGSITLGFSNERGDNTKFSYTPSNQTYINVPVDGSGNADTRNFTIVAPTTDGYYTLTADAIDVVQGGSAHFKFATGSIEIKVGNPTNNNDDDDDGNPPEDLTVLYIIIALGATIGGIAGVVIVLIKRQKSKRFF